MITGPPESEDSEMESPRPVLNRFCFPLRLKTGQSQNSPTCVWARRDSLHEACGGLFWRTRTGG